MPDAWLPLARPDIQVHAEEIAEIVLALDLDQAVVVRAVCITKLRLLFFAETGEVEVGAATREGSHRGKGIARPGDVARIVRAIVPGRLSRIEVRRGAAPERSLCISDTRDSAAEVPDDTVAHGRRTCGVSLQHHIDCGIAQVVDIG